MRALLLNSDYTPLHFVSDEEAIILFYKGRAEVYVGRDGPSVWDEIWNSPSTSIHVPATIILRKRVNKRWKPPRFRKKVLFNRDGWKCQYCGTQLGWNNITIDHVLPQARGGPTSWLNCVTSCRPCNRYKDCQTSEEAGMKLLKKPTNPTSLHFWDAMRSDSWHSDWDCFIPRE